MKRNLMEKLKAWHNDSEHRPLLLRGARQVGKTWLMQTFGQESYEKTAYIRFDHASPLREIFSTETNVANLLQAIQMHTGKLVEPHKTLLIFDEIQECPGALASLKFFCEDAPEIDIIAAGSLLGISEHVGTGFPVGKVDTLHLYPMTFAEFLEAIGKGDFAQLIQSHNWQMMSYFHDELVRLLKLYFFVGGMPQIVENFSRHGDFQKVRHLQNSLLSDYRSDFGKHTTANTVRKLEVLWDSIPVQLARENRKFVYHDVQPGARSRELAEAIHWLVAAGLTRHIHRVTKPDLPLEGYQDGAFKCFMLDVGLLAAKAKLPSSALLEQSAVFEEFKGALTEQFVQQEIVAEQDEAPHYWASQHGDAEVDFIMQHEGCVIPVEVKASVNVRAKSLKFYCEKFRPPMAVRCSLVKYYRQLLNYGGDTTNTGYEFIDLPLYAVSQLRALSGNSPS